MKIKNELQALNDTCHIAYGNCPVILLGPHNGYKTPPTLDDKLHQPLGLPKAWFDPNNSQKRHEACDWGGQELLRDLLTGHDAELNFYAVEARYSRLVCDLNRIPEKCLTSNLSELEQPVPMNVDLSDTEKQDRIDMFYTPYFEAVRNVVSHAKQTYGGAVIIDLHSYTPTWQGQERNYHMGTMKWHENIFSQILDEYVLENCDRHGLIYKPNMPYDVTQPPLRDEWCGKRITSLFSVYYHAFECRNDLLQNPKKRAVIVTIILDAIAKFIEHPNFHNIIKMSK